MASTLGLRLTALQTEVTQQRQLVQRQIGQIDKQQAVLDIQFRRIADMQAELDLVKAAVRLVAPTIAASLTGLTSVSLFSAARA